MRIKRTADVLGPNGCYFDPGDTFEEYDAPAASPSFDIAQEDFEEAAWAARFRLHRRLMARKGGA